MNSNTESIAGNPLFERHRKLSSLLDEAAELMWELGSKTTSSSRREILKDPVEILNYYRFEVFNKKPGCENKEKK